MIGYLILGYLVLAATLSILARDLCKGAVRAGLLVCSVGLLFNLLNPAGIDIRLALAFAAGLACFGGWTLLTSLLRYDDALQERWDAAQAEPERATDENANEEVR